MPWWAPYWPVGARPSAALEDAFQMYARDVPAGQIFYHGTKADLNVGDLIGPGIATASSGR
jgi:hypothetical protein